MIIVELFAYVQVPLHHRGTEYVADLRAGPVDRTCGAVFCSCWNDDRAGELAIVKLIDHQ